MVSLVKGEGSALFPVPVVSVDRAVWYCLEDIDVDYSSIAAYYASLPYPSKPRLEDCRIHISGLACVVKRRNSGSLPGSAAPQIHADDSFPPALRRERFFRKNLLIDGVHLLEPDDAALFDSLAPPADVLLLLGSSVLVNDPSRLIPALEEQLAAYARGKEVWPPMSGEEKRWREKLRRQEPAGRGEPEGLVGAAGGAVQGGAFSLISLDTPLTILISMGFGAAENVVTSASKRRASRKVRKGLLACIYEREATIRAESPPASLSTSAVKVKLRKGDGVRYPIMRAPYGRRWPFSFIDRVIDEHRLPRSLHQLPLNKA